MSCAFLSPNHPISIRSQLQLHRNYNYNYNYTALPPTTVRSISGFCYAIHDSQQPTSYSLLSLKLPPSPCAVHTGMILSHLTFSWRFACCGSGGSGGITEGTWTGGVCHLLHRLVQVVNWPSGMLKSGVSCGKALGFLWKMTYAWWIFCIDIRCFGDGQNFELCSANFWHYRRIYHDHCLQKLRCDMLWRNWNVAFHNSSRKKSFYQKI